MQESRPPGSARHPITKEHKANAAALSFERDRAVASVPLDPGSGETNLGN